MEALIGKTVVKVEMGEIDPHGSDAEVGEIDPYDNVSEVVDQVFRVTCSDGDVLYFGCDAFPDSRHYATFSSMKKKHWDEMVRDGKWHTPLKEVKKSKK